MGCSFSVFENNLIAPWCPFSKSIYSDEKLLEVYHLCSFDTVTTCTEPQNEYKIAKPFITASTTWMAILLDPIMRTCSEVPKMFLWILTLGSEILLTELT